MFSRTETVEQIRFRTSHRDGEFCDGEVRKIEGGQFLLQIFRTNGTIDSERLFTYDLEGEIEIEHALGGDFTMVCKNSSQK